jgi:DNA-binding NarL/FixJ family response regulator
MHPDPWFTVVVIGDDELLGRVEPALRQDPALLVTATVDAHRAVEVTVDRAPDVVIVADPPGGDGQVTAAAIGAELGVRLPATRILVIADPAAPSTPEDLIDGWVGGVVPAAAIDELAPTVRQMALGEAHLDPPLAAAVLARHHAASSDLTPTEAEVVGRIAGGATVDDIARQYAVSARMVRLHAGGALTRLHPAV